MYKYRISALLNDTHTHTHTQTPIFANEKTYYTFHSLVIPVKTNRTHTHTNTQ